jgi:hypothetical protein
MVTILYFLLQLLFKLLRCICILFVVAFWKLACVLFWFLHRKIRSFVTHMFNSVFNDYAFCVRCLQTLVCIHAAKISMQLSLVAIPLSFKLLLKLYASSKNFYFAMTLANGQAFIVEKTQSVLVTLIVIPLISCFILIFFGYKIGKS